MGLLLIGDKVACVATVGPRGVSTGLHVQLPAGDGVRAVLAGVPARVARPRREALVLLKQLLAYILCQPHSIPSLVVVPTWSSYHPTCIAILGDGAGMSAMLDLAKTPGRRRHHHWGSGVWLPASRPSIPPSSRTTQTRRSIYQRC